MAKRGMAALEAILRSLHEAGRHQAKALLPSIDDTRDADVVEKDRRGKKNAPLDART